MYELPNTSLYFAVLNFYNPNTFKNNSNFIKIREFKLFFNKYG